MTEREEQAVIVLNTLYNNPLLSDIHRQALEVGIMAIKAESSSEKPNKWIPVSERLPEAGEYVGDVVKYYLVQNEYGDMMVARYTHSEYWRQIYQLKPIGDEIVAWMPLPQKYKEEIPTGSEGSDKE